MGLVLAIKELLVGLLLADLPREDIELFELLDYRVDHCGVENGLVWVLVNRLLCCYSLL